MALYNADESKVNLFRFDLLKPLIDSELRDRLPEMLAGGLEEFEAATIPFIQKAKARALKLCECMKEEDSIALKLACTVLTIAGCNAVFPADYPYAMVMLFLDSGGVHHYATLHRRLVSKIDLNDGFIRVPMLNAKSVEDFQAGRYKLGWLVNKDINPRE